MPDKSMKELENELMQLSQETRASLAEKLIRSLEAEQHTEVETAWIEELERRYRAIQNGEVDALDADKVFSSIRSQL